MSDLDDALDRQLDVLSTHYEERIAALRAQIGELQASSGTCRMTPEKGESRK